MMTSRQVKRIESTTRSPVYSLLSETLDGLPTVRAFAAQHRFQQMFVDTQNENIRAFFTYIASARWLGYARAIFFCISSFLENDLLIAKHNYIGSAWTPWEAPFWPSLHLRVWPVGLLNRYDRHPGLVGFSLSYVIQFLSQLQWAVRQTVEVEITFISVERMLSYTKLAPEAPCITSLRPPQLWPDHAEVQFINMSLTYPGTSDPVLKNININIKPHEKIGIVGRTGAGKSSLLTSLFRLIESEPAGSIRIDGISTSELGTYDLRSRLSIIPQEPFLFKGNLRFNLDPFNEYDDLAIWRVLEATELKRKIERMPGGLETAVTENGKNFSVGERQLISLCRAILRNARLVVMDEATANIDLASDRLIQRSIHTYFRNATVLTIAHRLNTVIGDYDRILVLEAGEVVEFGEPHELLQREDGWLTHMVKQTGPESERELRNVAEALWKRTHCVEESSQDITDVPVDGQK
ncbi:P-loop containing nucleoside triphosphate hydrolase protein [Jimgerdemannia flammicorona]|uniref:P-loop containing nucleoside triphosphate hydrolase protein n=1 Tax=Jimgerdemannia flammicorona TaxID=994334 RepID=A0A433PFA7_9FUNG|nr:P-loop containing nucleoside triphosphate hydrolase protein [Jimgerdemannia flammicorona]